MKPRFIIGDYVVAIVDPRHEARVDAILFQTTLRVTFTESRWRADMRPDELQLVRRPPAYNNALIARQRAARLASRHARDPRPRRSAR
jgi:hypothetical protein